MDLRSDIVKCIQIAQSTPGNIDADLTADRLMQRIDAHINHMDNERSKAAYAQGRSMGIKEAFAEMRKRTTE